MNNQGTVLIVEDTTSLLTFLEFILQEHGFATIMADCGELALNILEKQIPDLILLDILMPGIDGYEVCRQIKTQEYLKHIPIIFLTALTGKSDRVKGLKLGAVDYILKPFEENELLLKVHNQIILRRLTVEIQDKTTELLNYKEHLEIMVQKRTEELENTNATKDKLLSIIAHDLKNPFAAVLSSVDLLFLYLEKNDLVKAKAKVETIQNTTKHGYALLQNLLEWSCSQKGILNFQPTRNDISIIVRNCIDLLKLSAENKNIQVVNNITNQIFAKIDTNYVTTILRNLISNAIKFTNEKGKVEINAKINESEIEISISDTGIGMSDNTLEKLFRIDEKVATSGTSGEKGTGLGLILCKEFIQHNNGRFWVQSEPGKGATFYLALPVA